MIFLASKLTCLVIALLAVNPEDPRKEISAVLAEYQRARAAADARAFFASFADDAIVMGTAPTERFELDAYRAWSAPMFAGGRPAVVTLVEENITVADDGQFAWFDQHTRRAGLGDMRMTGILRKAEDRWQFVQLNLVFPVPNEIIPALVPHLRDTHPGRATEPQGRVVEKPEAEGALAVKAVLTDFHRAAAEADLEGYFEHLTEDAVVLGTAVGERWTNEAYRPVVESIFAQSGGWRSTPIDRHVYLTTDGRHAWFDERRLREGVGELRNSGVLRREHGTWKIVYSSRALVIPNEVVPEFVRLRDQAMTSEDLAKQLLDGGPSPVTAEKRSIDLGPTAWPEGEFARLIERGRTWGRPQPEASGKAGMVAGTTHVLAVRTGVEALRRGGTAMDAACVTALTQISLNAGATVSYAGIMALVYYEAASGETHALLAPYATPLGEKTPLTIPMPGTPTGRTALVPGFMKGIESAHQRFGKLPFASLFGPAIFFAERGVIIEGPLEAWIRGKTEVLSRRPETRAVFTNDQGEFAPHGSLLRQPALTATLRRVAAEGAAHMYTGDWARDFVSAAQADGGKISAEDLARYDVAWSEPLRTTYRGREIAAVPQIGGRKLLESLNLLELADLAQYGHSSESAESCYWLIQCTRMPRFTPGTSNLKQLLSGTVADTEQRLSKENAQRIWKLMQKPNYMRLLQGLPPLKDEDRNSSGGHSDAVVAVDAAGNVAAMLHTINTESWGTTGLFVNGVSIPDSAAYLQMRMMRAGPGGYIPNEMNPSIVLARGKPILASSAVGRGLHEATVGCLHSILDFGMTPGEAQQKPSMMTSYSMQGASRAVQLQQVMPAGRYPDELLSGLLTLGQETVQLEPHQASTYRGYWIGIAIDPTTAERRGAVDSTFNGAALVE